MLCEKLQSIASSYLCKPISIGHRADASIITVHSYDILIITDPQL